MKTLNRMLATLTIGALTVAGLPAQAADEDKTPSELRAQVDSIGTNAIETLRESNENFAKLYDKAAGYAVFRATKGGFIVTGAGGTGVAVDKAAGTRTYMHMGAGGVGLGAGLQNYRPIFLFETQAALDTFVNGGWDASTAAQAAAGKSGVNATSSFVDGVAVYQLTDKGLMAQADLTGTRFWKSEKLNAADPES